MPINVTRQLANAADILRRKLKPEDSKADLLSGDKVILTLDDDSGGWNWKTVDQRAAGGKRFTQFTVYDTGDVPRLSEALRRLDGIRINGRHFKKTDLFEPEEATQKWVIELQPTGK